MGVDFVPIPVSNAFAYGAVNPAVAFAMALVGALFGLSCTARARNTASRRLRIQWLIFGAIALAVVGVWLPHFIAVLGFDVPASLIRYSLLQTAISLLIAIVAVGIGLQIVGKPAVAKPAIGRPAVESQGAGPHAAGLHDVGLNGVSPHDAGLRGSRLHDVKLRGAGLHDVGLHSTELKGARLQDARPKGASGRPSVTRITAAGALIGAGITAMHYTGVNASHIQGYYSYDARLVAVSALVAVLGSIVALGLTVWTKGYLSVIAASVVFAVTVVAMHYTGMAAMHVHLTDTDRLPPGVPAISIVIPVSIGGILTLLGMLFAVLGMMSDDDAVTGSSAATGVAPAALKVPPLRVEWTIPTSSLFSADGSVAADGSAAAEKER
jgi:NO-binding membrane sensor protein with MHYT domain